MALLESDRKNQLRSNLEEELKILQEQLDSLNSYSSLLNNIGFKKLYSEIKNKLDYKEHVLEQEQQELLELDNITDQQKIMRLEKLKRLNAEIHTSQAILDPVINSNKHIKNLENMISDIKDQIDKLEA